MEGQKFLPHYFDLIKQSELLNHILAKLLNDSLTETFFGHIAEQVPSNNLTFIQMARLTPKKLFTTFRLCSPQLRTVEFQSEEQEMRNLENAFIVK